MSIAQVNSQSLMGLLENSKNRITALEQNAATMKLNLDSRLSVIRNIIEYEQKQAIELKSMIDNGRWIEQATKIVLPRADILEGVYSQFGSTFHPKFLKDPTDVFNFKTVTGYSFKDQGVIMFNDIVKPRYKAALMHDTISGQDICFEEFTTPTLDISIKINPAELLGSTAFNVIELVPYIPGSFSIQSCQVYSLQGYYMGETMAESNMPNTISNVGCCRLLLDQTINLYELKLGIHINYQNSEGYFPFGIKHIYLLNAEMDKNSYAVLKISENKYIDTISEDITIVDQTGTVSTNCHDEGIELYQDWTNGIGIDSIATTKGLTNNPIPRDIKDFYVYLPIERSITSIQFNSINLR